MKQGLGDGIFFYGREGIEASIYGKWIHSILLRKIDTIPEYQL